MHGSGHNGKWQPSSPAFERRCLRMCPPRLRTVRHCRQSLPRRHDGPARHPHPLTQVPVADNAAHAWLAQCLIKTANLEQCRPAEGQGGHVHTLDLQEGG